jgi:hypothetical protein
MEETYKRIQAYAKENAIDLDNSWMVWTLDSGTPLLCGKVAQRGFDDAAMAFHWARQHVHLKRVVVTGPEGRYTEMEETDRYPIV